MSFEWKEMFYFNNFKDLSLNVEKNQISNNIFSRLILIISDSLKPHIDKLFVDSD